MPGELVAPGIRHLPPRGMHALLRLLEYSASSISELGFRVRVYDLGFLGCLGFSGFRVYRV